MGKISVEHSRLAPSVSVALVKDEDSGVKVWRYRFLFTSRSGTAFKHSLKDYAYEDFDNLEQFKSRIEFQRQAEKNLLENK
jgi:hypothetical protein